MDINVNLSVDKPVETVISEVKIPLNPLNFIRLDGTNLIPDKWVDGDTQTFNPAVFGNTVVPDAERMMLYDFRDMRNVIVSRIRIFDLFNNLTSNPIKVYGIDEYNNHIHLFDFTGALYNQWVDFPLETPIRVKFLAFTTSAAGTGNSTTEMEVWGSYESVSPDKLPPTSFPVKPIPFRQLCGTNGYPWMLLGIQQGPVETHKLDAAKQYGVYRVYHDWRYIENAEGEYTFHQSMNGGWRMDWFYEALKENNIIAIPSIQKIPNWLANTWSPANTNYRPHRGGKNPTDIWSYQEQARAIFNFAARYGNGDGFNVVATITDINQLPVSANENDTYLLQEVLGNNNQTVIGRAYTWKSGEWKELLSIKRTQQWDNDQINSIKIGLNTVEYVEVGNENNKHWFGINGYQSGSQHAANLSAVYDGHMGTMGDGFGVKNASSNIKVTTNGLAGIHYNYIMEIIYWSMRHRGFKPDGTVNVPFDVINFHSYRNTQGSEQHQGEGRKGMAPEPSGFSESIIRFRELVWRYLGPDFLIILTETGYDLHPSSPQSPVPFSNYDTEDIQGIWILRTMLEAVINGVDMVAPYEVIDNEPGDPTIYNTSGMNNPDFTPRVVSRFIVQCRKLIDEHVYDGVVEQSDVWCIRFRSEGSLAYFIWVPAVETGTETFTLSSLPNHSSAKLHELDFDGTETIETTLSVSSSYTVTSTEVPKILIIEI